MRNVLLMSLLILLTSCKTFDWKPNYYVASVADNVWVNKVGDSFVLDAPMVEMGVWLPRENFIDLIAEIDHINGQKKALSPVREEAENIIKFIDSPR